MELFRSETVHLLLLDIMMPEPDGYAVLRKVRESSKLPVIMLSARGADHEKILGLELGADDYIAKPFNPLEAAARIKAQLRRCYDFTPSKEERIMLRGLVLEPAEGSLTKNGVPVQLTSTEYKILLCLMSSPGRIFTKRQIAGQVWDDFYIENENSLTTHLCNLRAKIEDDPKHPVIIKTIKGLGYRVEK